jgi:hypothetical protein
MAHNVSTERKARIERARRVGELREFLVPGWRLDLERLEIVEVNTALGHYQRGQQLLLLCRKADCRRRVEVDLRSAIEAGLSDQPVAVLLERLRCRHWQGCELAQAHAIYPNGVPLVSYLKEKDRLIAIACTACGGRSLLPPAEVIKRLTSVGRGNGNTGIIELARAVRGPCRRCGHQRFTTSAVKTK